MSLRSHVCPPTFWKVGFFVYNGYPLANTFFTHCYFMQLKKYASGLLWFMLAVIKYDYILKDIQLDDLKMIN